MLHPTRPLLSRLTTGTNVGTATGHFKQDEARATTITRFAGAAVRMQLLLKGTRFALTVHVIPDRRSTRLERFLQNATNIFVQCPDLGLLQTSRRSLGMDPGQIKGLIHVNVAQAR